MYGVGPSVANVTANGEEIVSVTEWGLSSMCDYTYNSNKHVSICVNKGKITNIEISFLNSDYEILELHVYNNLTQEQKNSFFPNEEKELLTQDALRRYKADHRKPKGGICNFL